MATNTAVVSFTEADYALREQVTDAILDSRMGTCAAIRALGTKTKDHPNGLGTSVFAQRTLCDLKSKMNNVALTSPQLEMARGILRQHKNLLVRIFGAEVKAKIQRREAADARKIQVVTSAPVDTAAVTVVSADNVVENPPALTDADVPF